MPLFNSLQKVLFAFQIKPFLLGPKSSFGFQILGHEKFFSAPLISLRLAPNQTPILN